MIRLALAGVDTFVGSTLCACCPLGPTGCCAAPPAFTWSDAGRIALRGGKTWLAAELAAGRLRPSPRGLAVLRRPGATDPSLRCAYHGATGCTIPPERRSATCNDYVCDDALAEAHESAPDVAAAARVAHERLTSMHARWDEHLAAASRARWPDGPPWDAAFLDFLAAEHATLEREHAHELGALGA